jgi:hypothetical protein
MIQRNRLNADIARRYDLLQHAFSKFSNDVSERLHKLEDAVRSQDRSQPTSKSKPSFQPPLRSSRDDVTNNASAPLRTPRDDVGNNASASASYGSTQEAGKQFHGITGQINEQFITCRRTKETKNSGARSKRNSEADTINDEIEISGEPSYGHQPQLPGAASTPHLPLPNNPPLTSRTYADAAAKKPALSTTQDQTFVRPKPIYGNKAKEGGNYFKQSNYIKKKIFISTHDIATTSDHITNIVKSITRVAPLSCLQLRTKYDTYVSFCITVTENHFSNILNPQHWEEDFLIMPFEGKSRLRSQTTSANRRDNRLPRDPSPSRDPTPSLIPTPLKASHATASDEVLPPPSSPTNTVVSQATVNPSSTSNQEILTLNAEIENLKRQNQELGLHLANSWDVKSSVGDEDKSDVSSNHSDATSPEERLQLSEIPDQD